MRIAIALVALTGCLDNLDLSFSSQGTSIRVTGEPRQTHVTVCPGPTGLLSCNGEEEITVSVGSDSRPATAGLFGMEEALFGAADADTVVTVLRTRDGARATATLPAPFTLAGPPAGTSVPDGVIPASWEPGAGDPMVWHVELACASGGYTGEEHALDDDGTARFPVGGRPEGATGPCSGTVVVTRRRDGAVGAFGPESTMIAEQIRSISFEIR